MTLASRIALRSIFAGLLLCSFGAGLARAQNWSSVISAGGSGNESVSRAVVDREGNKYVLGKYTQAASFGSKSLPTPLFPSVYLAKYDSHDQIVWVRSLATPADSFQSVSAGGLALAPNGNIVVAGRFRTLLGDGTPYGLRFEDTLLTGVGASAMYLAALSSDGSRAWVRAMSQPGVGSFGQNTIGAIAVGRDGSIFVTGTYNTTALLDTITLMTSNTSESFVARFTGSGRVIWARTSASQGPANGHSIAVDSNGTCYAAGVYFVNITFDSTNIPAGNAEQKIFLLKIASNGTLDWAERLGSGGYYGAAYDMAIASDGHPLLTGFYRSDIDLGTTHLVYNNGLKYAALLVKLDTAGKPEWAVASDGPNQNAIAYGVSAASDGSAWMTGVCLQTSRFGDFQLLDTNISNGNSFIAHVSGQGKFLWADELGKEECEGDAVAALANGSAVLAGTYSGTMRVGSQAVSSQGGSDIYLAEVSALSGVRLKDRTIAEAAYPNPARDFLRLSNAPMPVVRLIDAAGRERLVACNGGLLNVRDLPSGEYQIVAGAQTFRFVKSN